MNKGSEDSIKKTTVTNGGGDRRKLLTMLNKSISDISDRYNCAIKRDAEFLHLMNNVHFQGVGRIQDALSIMHQIENFRFDNSGIITNGANVCLSTSAYSGRFLQ